MRLRPLTPALSRRPSPAEGRGFALLFPLPLAGEGGPRQRVG